MSDHPGVISKDGPSGQRAALGYGPDIWERSATPTRWRHVPKKHGESSAVNDLSPEPPSGEPVP
jgi:hypothetical protein